MKNTIIILLIMLLTVGAGAYVFSNSSDSGQDRDNSNKNVQRVVLSMKNYNYYPQIVEVKAGQPVSISLDSSVKGCYRSFTIRDFGIAEYLATPSDTVDFTPNRKGTFTFACSMGMGYGKLVVK